MNIKCLSILFIFSFSKPCSLREIHVYGPGLEPHNIVMPARYFFINFTVPYTKVLNEKLAVEITGKSYEYKTDCRVWVNKLNRKDGTFIIRYKVYDPCYDFAINIYYENKHIKGSPWLFSGLILADHCNCPEQDYLSWAQKYGCPTNYNQIDQDLKIYDDINMNQLIKKILTKYHRPESTSFCHYVIKNNNIYRNCYGKYVGFSMFSDNIFLFLTRLYKMPDIELVINLGDWPLVKKGSEYLPIFSWCGSDQSLDIVMPTYDITESTLENMGRVTLDLLSVQGSVERDWSYRETQVFWRGRDSSQERLKLMDIARANPELFNVSLTNFFFFRDKEKEYGPKQPHVSFFKFFDYKYQVNIDGTVAAYRLAYLLAGGSLVFKQESPYYEHFYKELKPWTHYVPIKRDLSDLKKHILWARDNDDDAKKIAENGRRFAFEHLLPRDIICYHAVLFWEWSKKLKNSFTVAENMTHIPQKLTSCKCHLENSQSHVEL